MITFVKYRDSKNEFRWALWSAGDRIADSGEGYKNKNDMEHEIGVIVEEAASAKVQDRTGE